MIGTFYIAAASFSIALGAFLISNVFYGTPLHQISRLYSDARGLQLVLGIFLNAVGSVLWIFGRRELTSYLFAWTFYLAMLVIFGAVIACVAEKNMPSYLQIFGMLLMVGSIILIKR